MAGPLQQFEIKYIWDFWLWGWNFGITNSTLAMMISLTCLSIFLYFGAHKGKIIPGKMQSAVEMLYFAIHNLYKENVSASGAKYFPLVLTIFLYIFAMNIFGLMPYAFTVTSHIIITFVMATFVILFITIAGLIKNGASFFSVFLPSGTPGWMAPLMLIIEIFAYFSRAISLSIRLAANMTIGHTMLKVIAGFVVGASVLQATIPFLFTTCLFAFELFVAILQAYIFTILTCVYLNSVLELDH